MVQLKLSDKVQEQDHLVILFNEFKQYKELFPSEVEWKYIKDQIAEKKDIIHVHQYTRHFFLIQKPHILDVPQKAEKLRKIGYDLFQLLETHKIKEVTIENNTPSIENILDLAEGLLLSTYSFDKYKTKPTTKHLKTIKVVDLALGKHQIKELSHLVEGVFLARDLVNEPLSYLTAEKLSEEIEDLGKQAGFKVDVLKKDKIKELKMGGLIAVNLGSPNPPTFTILEYKPEKPIHKKPIVLVGKGVVYDTGGMSLKPADSLEWMKCDMGGAAAVVGAIYAIAKNKLPVHVIGLIPATENRPDGNAYVPGDIITQMDGTTVEVLNTDAEGRLILADALCYAKKYKPELVIDIATLTGSAMRALGKEGIVYMGTASQDVKNEMELVGLISHERLVEFPLWDEYAEQIKSDVADLKNIGGPDAGAITAGKFLQHFTDYPWLHLDIAGGAFLKTKDSYRGMHGTGIGVRLFYQYLHSKVISHQLAKAI